MHIPVPFTCVGPVLHSISRQPIREGDSVRDVIALVRVPMVYSITPVSDQFHFRITVTLPGMTLTGVWSQFKQYKEAGRKFGLSSLFFRRRTKKIWQNGNGSKK